jgi:hypothetical protein
VTSWADEVREIRRSQLRAIHCSGEYDLLIEDVPYALAYARSERLAVTNWQVQFELPGGTYELHWHGGEVSPRQEDETWDSFVDRSHREVGAVLSRLPSADSLVIEGVENFSLLKERAASGVDLRPFLRFFCYLAAEST